MKQFIVVLFLFSISSMVYGQELTPGTEMPKAVFYKTTGGTFSTDQIGKGKKTLLMYFDATCGHCQETAALMSKRSKELSHVSLMLITQDEQRSIDYFMTNFAKPLIGLKNVTVLQDKDHVFVPLFRPKQFPSLYLFGADKRLVYYSSKDKDVPKFFNLVKP